MVRDDEAPLRARLRRGIEPGRRDRVAQPEEPLRDRGREVLRREFVVRRRHDEVGVLDAPQRLASLEQDYELGRTLGQAAMKEWAAFDVSR